MSRCVSGLQEMSKSPKHPTFRFLVPQLPNLATYEGLLGGIAGDSFVIELRSKAVQDK